MLIDSHCHLEYDYAPKDVAALLAEAKTAGIDYLVTIGTDVASWPKVAAISESHPEIFHTVGMHPHETIDLTPEGLELLAKAATHPKCRAVGEIGLDYHYDHSPRDIQRARLGDQLEIARRTRQPIVIHSREGEADILEQLTDHAKKLPTGMLPGVIHCFTGTKEFGRACLDLGFYISFSGILTFKKADDLRDCAREFPLERLLVETDSPYLAPMPHRGKQCEPSMVRLTAEKLAEVKGVTFEEVAKSTTANARKLFRIHE
jgi:TatD DNase family protein